MEGEFIRKKTQERPKELMLLNCVGVEAVWKLCSFLSYCWQFNEQLKYKTEDS